MPIVPLHPALEKEDHPREHRDHAHLGVLASHGKSQEGRRRHIGDPTPQGHLATEADLAQIDVHAQPGAKHRQDIAPADIALESGKKVDEIGGEILRADLLRLRETAHFGVPHRLGNGLDLFPEAHIGPLVIIGADIGAVDDIAGKGEFVEIDQTQQQEKRGGKIAALPQGKSRWGCRRRLRLGGALVLLGHRAPLVAKPSPNPESHRLLR